jgi:hypothetical protein
LKKLAAISVLAFPLLAGCAGAPQAATSATTGAASPSPSSSETAPQPALETQSPEPTPSAISISGDYGADLAAAGVVPDDGADYGKFMAKYMCDSPISGGLTFSDQVRMFGEPGGEAGGRGPAVVRLTVAYYCPERTELAEKYLKSNGYTS